MPEFHESLKPDEVFERYSKQLADLAQRHLSTRLQRRMDGEDIAQSVLRTFFRRSELGEFRFDNSTDLWKLLVTITLKKVHNKARHHHAERRDLSREHESLDAAAELPVLARGPSPAEAAELLDQVDWMLEGMTDTHREIFFLIVQGYSRTEVAEKLNVSRMTVHRVLDLLRDKLRL